MTGKIFRSILACALAAVILVLVAAVAFSYSYYSDEVERELKSEAVFIRAGVESYGTAFLDGVRDSKTRITLIDREGRVTYDTKLGADELAGLGSHLEREEVAEAIAYGEGFATRYSDTLSESTVYYALCLSDGGVLRISSLHRTVFDIMLDFAWPAAVLLILVTAIMFFVARGLSAAIVRPINDIDFDTPDVSLAYDELKPMISKLSYQNHKIARQLSELKKREGEFSSITSNMSEGMVIINARTTILSCNESAAKILGIERTDSVRSILYYDRRQSFRDAIRAALSGKNGYDEMTAGDKHYSIIVTPVSQESIVEGAVVVIIDDTEKEQREALRREFTSNVSHELKTPLTSISGFAELIRCGMAEGEEAKHFADNIHKEAKRLIRLVGDIIRLTQLDGGEIPYDGEINLLEVSREVVGRLMNIADSAGVRLSASGEPELVLGNERILEEMVYNLCDNAIKYNKRGGYVELSVKREGSRVLLSVKDNGIGIPDDKQDRVFERFYRVDKSHSKEIGGTGLGLSIVKHAAAYHKATIALRSRVGDGTEVTISFPGVKRAQK